MSWIKKTVKKLHRTGGRGSSSVPKPHTPTDPPQNPPKPAIEPPASQESLEDILYRQTAVSNYPSRSEDYFPNRTYALVTREAVRRHWHGQSNVDESLVDFIVDSAPKLYTIVLTAFSGGKARQVDLMKCFFKHGISDISLSPEIKLGDRTNPWLQPNELRRLDRGLWGDQAVRFMCEQQWKVLIPVFSIERASYDLSSQTILPFQKVKGKAAAEGAFGIVHEVKIEEGHFLGDTMTHGTSGKYEWPKTFAVKEIKPKEDVRGEMERTFKSEANHLQRMSSHYSDHIIRFVTAFTTIFDEDIGSRKYYLVFEWADGGSLHDLFTQHRNPTLSKGLITSVYKQIQGLATALQLTHEKAMIRHGDLKPGNILRFKNPRPGSSDGMEGEEEDIIGTLKIGDWGLAKYHAVATELRDEHTKTVHGTAMYEPPEVNPDLYLGVGTNKKLGRSYDLWSMGCIILEVIIWLLYGYEGVRDFQNDVRSHKATVAIPCYVVEVVIGSDPVRNQAKVSPIVKRWLDHLSKEELCGSNQALGRLLQIVRQDLLVVDLPRLDRAATMDSVNHPVSRQNLDDLDDSDTDGIPGIRITRTATFKAEDANNATASTKTATRATSTQLVDKLRKAFDSQGIDPRSDWWYKPRSRPPLKPNFAPSASQDTSGGLSPNMNRRQPQTTRVADQTVLPRQMTPQPPNEHSASPIVRLSAPGLGGLSVPLADGHLSPRHPNMVCARPTSPHTLHADPKS